MMTRFRISTTVALVCLVVDGRNVYSNDAVRQAFPDPSAARGVVVVAGAGDVKPVVALAKAAPVVVLAVAADEDAASRLASDFRKAGVYGQVTTHALGKYGRITLADNSAATVIADLDSLAGLSPDEARRVLRPFGRLFLKENGN